MKPLRVVRDLFRKMGYEISRHAPDFDPRGRRRKRFAAYGVTTVFDVGANAGQYGRMLRADGFRGRIVSFEPLAGPYAELERHAAADPAWEAYHLALGDKDEAAEIHVSASSPSSSLLPILPGHVAAAPESRCVGTEKIEVRTLDGLASALLRSGETVYLKIDAQGFEARVLKGAAASLARIGLLEVELSLEPLYEGAELFEAMLARIQGLGYRLVDVEPAFVEPSTGRVLQIDGVFQRLS